MRSIIYAETCEKAKTKRKTNGEWRRSNRRKKCLQTSQTHLSCLTVKSKTFLRCSSLSIDFGSTYFCFWTKYACISSIHMVCVWTLCLNVLVENRTIFSGRRRWKCVCTHVRESYDTSHSNWLLFGLFVRNGCDCVLCMCEWQLVDVDIVWKAFAVRDVRACVCARVSSYHHLSTRENSPNDLDSDIT